MSRTSKQPKPKEPGLHHTASILLDRRVNIALIGAGGNGSQMLSGLARLHTALVRLGHPGGLDVTIFDPDKVSESNVGRQLFYAADIGLYKATVLANRFNLAFGLDWKAVPELWGTTNTRQTHGTNLVISCVDTAASRRQIHQLLEAYYSKPQYWLDLGNRQRDGQVILGQPKDSTHPHYTEARGKTPEQVAEARKALEKARLSCVTDVFPELLDSSFKEENAPSCSLAEALGKQDLFINQSVATFALDLLWRLFREGKIRHHGAFINLETGRVNPLPVPST